MADVGVKFVAEVLFDAFLRFRAPSSGAATPSPDGGSHATAPSSVGLPAAFGELRGIVDLALRFQDQSQALAGVTSHRVDRLLAMNLALAGFLSAWIQWAGKNIPRDVATYGHILVSVALYLAGKSVLHAMFSISARQRRVISADLVDVGLRRAAGHDGRQDLINILCQIRDNERANEKARAVSVEHSMLCWHTSAAQVLVTLAVFLGAVWAPPRPDEPASVVQQTNAMPGFRIPVPTATPEHPTDGGTPAPGAGGAASVTTTSGTLRDGGTFRLDAAAR